MFVGDRRHTETSTDISVNVDCAKLRVKAFWIRDFLLLLLLEAKRDTQANTNRQIDAFAQNELLNVAILRVHPGLELTTIGSKITQS